MNTSHQLPAKVQALLSSLDREQIAYALEVTELGNHRTGYSVTSVDGLWFEASVHSYFIHTAGHISEFGTKFNSSTRHTTWVSGATCERQETKSASTASVLWSVYGKRHASKVGA